MKYLLQSYIIQTKDEHLVLESHNTRTFSIATTSTWSYLLPRFVKSVLQRRRRRGSFAEVIDVQSVHPVIVQCAGNLLIVLKRSITFKLPIHAPVIFVQCSFLHIP